MTLDDLKIEETDVIDTGNNTTAADICVNNMSLVLVKRGELRLMRTECPAAPEPHGEF